MGEKKGRKQELFHLRESVRKAGHEVSGLATLSSMKVLKLAM